MKNTIEKIQDSIDAIKTSINTKYQNNVKEAPIKDDTLLEKYALAIDNIPTETIDISQQIFVFYCWATNEADAKSKTKPTITWNNDDKWIIKCDPIGWNTSADEEELDPNQPNAEKYLYAWFVSVNTNSNNTGLPEPDPVRLTGKTGAKGEDGSDGRDGVIAGLTLRNNITLYCASNDKPVIGSINYDQGTDLSQLVPANIKINNAQISLDPTSYANQLWSQTYSIDPNNPIKIWKVDVMYASNSKAENLGDPVLITNVIDVEIKYGTSNSTEIKPNTWDNEYPKNTTDIVWIQRNEKLSDYTVKTIEYPIGLRGPAGIQFIGSVESESDLLSISPNYDNDYIGKLGVRVGQDVYIWYGTEDPYLTGSEQIGSNWWLNVGPLSPIPDWNAKEEEVGHVKNRTHYYYNIVKTISDQDNPTCDVPKNIKSFIITDANNNVITDYCIIGNILHINSEFTFPYTITFEICKQLDSKFIPPIGEMNIDYDDLNQMRKNGKLIPEAKYSFVYDEDTDTTITVTAIDPYLFDPRATLSFNGDGKVIPIEYTMEEITRFYLTKSQEFFVNYGTASYYCGIDNILSILNRYISDSIYEESPDDYYNNEAVNITFNKIDDSSGHDNTDHSNNFVFKYGNDILLTFKDLGYTGPGGTFNTDKNTIRKIVDEIKNALGGSWNKYLTQYNSEFNFEKIKYTKGCVLKMFYRNIELPFYDPNIIDDCWHNTKLTTFFIDDNECLFKDMTSYKGQFYPIWWNKNTQLN